MSLNTYTTYLPNYNPYINKNSMNYNYNNSIDHNHNPHSLHQCNDLYFDHRFPSYNTFATSFKTKNNNHNNLRGFLPADSYMFTKEGIVRNYCQKRQIHHDELVVNTGGPIYGVTMGACLPRASQSSVLDFTGYFKPFKPCHHRKTPNFHF